jgi:hypothetical protein
MSIPEFHEWRVALHHRETRGEFARKTESVGAWLRSNARCVTDGTPQDWIAVGIVPSQREASELLDRFQEEMSR